MKNNIEMRTPTGARLVEVIETRAVRGDGTKENPVREVTQYWSIDGELLAEKDIIQECSYLGQ